MYRLIGSLAGLLTTVSFVPQVMRVAKTKSTQDISLSMFIIFCCGVFLWLVYGISRYDLPIILTNAVTFILAGIILVYKIRFK